MDDYCQEIHRLLSKLPRFRFPFDEAEIPLNGIYILFEKGERGHGTDRIVRIGTHTGKNQLRTRLCQHFLMENKDRSIFRKNVGRALLNRKKDLFLSQWNWDLTTKLAKTKYGQLVNLRKLKHVEQEVSQYMRGSFSFSAFQVDAKEQRLRLESKIISTVSLCHDCKPSPKWLGLSSPLDKIRTSGLWLVNELYKEPLSIEDVKELKSLLI